jgi:hypothetical protein
MNDVWSHRLGVMEAAACGDMAAAIPGDAYELLRRAHVLLYYADSESSYMARHCIAKACTLLERAAMLLPAGLASEARELVRLCDEATERVVPCSGGLEEAASALLGKVT